jgi:hypothetical protein
MGLCIRAAIGGLHTTKARAMPGRGGVFVNIIEVSTCAWFYMNKPFPRSHKNVIVLTTGVPLYARLLIGVTRRGRRKRIAGHEYIPS